MLKFSTTKIDRKCSVFCRANTNLAVHNQLLTICERHVAVCRTLLTFAAGKSTCVLDDTPEYVVSEPRTTHIVRLTNNVSINKPAMSFLW